jgi:hypothetical protein
MQTQNKTLNIEPFKAQHILQMQITDKNHVLYRIPHLLQVYEDLKTSYTYIEGGKVFACGGVIQLWEGMGEAWFALADEMDLPVFTICKAIKEYLDGLIGAPYKRLQATVKCSDEKAIRFIEWLGFEREGLLRSYGVDGDDYYIYARGLWQKQ